MVLYDSKNNLAVHQARAVSRGLIRLLNSPMSSPIVCVAKKDGGVRLACDYRYLNLVTDGDVFLMPTIRSAA